jgi:hypothetical protein
MVMLDEDLYFTGSWLEGDCRPDLQQTMGQRSFSRGRR